MFPTNEPSRGARGGPGTTLRFVPSHSRNVEGRAPNPGLAIIRTLPFGSSDAGPSAMLRLGGKSGPAVQVAVFVLKIAV